MPIPSCGHCGSRFQPDEGVTVRRRPSGQREFLHERCRDAPPRQASAEYGQLLAELVRSLDVGQNWDPRLDVTSLRSNLLVSATDIANAGDEACQRHLAFKVRPGVKLRAWRRQFAPDGTPFPLGDIVDLVLAAHDEPDCGTYDGQQAWLERQLAARPVHRLTRRYIRHAVEAVLDAHEAVVEEVGPLRLLTRDPVVGEGDRQLTVWGPLYTSAANGGRLREVRRLRLGSAHAALEDADRRWVASAALVAALSPSPHEPTRVRVVEVGCSDGSVSVAFDGDLAEVLESYRSTAVPALPVAAAGHAPTPGWSCSSCKVTGGCEALVPLRGALGRDRLGTSTRAVSASELETYERCSARALMERTLHLPRQLSVGEAQLRGVAVHRWLELAHAGGAVCTAGDIPARLAADQVAAEAEVVAPFLAQHADVCPFRQPDVTLVDVEASVHGWDEAAGVVLTSKPDLIYRDAAGLVIRETKTSLRAPQDADEALRNYLQVPFLIVQLAAGLGRSLVGGGTCGTGRVELEVLTPESAVVFRWDAADPLHLAAARERLAAVVDSWHGDEDFLATPGMHCTSCPVRRWCPDRQEGALAPAQRQAESNASLDCAETNPPTSTAASWPDDVPF
jgi:hypothetical protein